MEMLTENVKDFLDVCQDLTNKNRIIFDPSKMIPLPSSLYKNFENSQEEEHT